MTRRRNGIHDRGTVALVGALTACAAALRLSTLDRQSFWSDEAITVLLVRMDFGELLRSVAETESTPPLYYVLAWIWAGAFGDGEVGLRSLSAVAGTLTVPVAYAAGTLLLGRRVGVAAAALVAFSPALVWYSQEARSYALAVLLVGVSFAATAAAIRRPSAATLATWAIASVLAIATHYFAGFVVAAEAAWLVCLQPRRAYGAVAAAVAGGLALLPLALKQRGNGFAEYIGVAGGGVPERTVVLAKQLVVGHALPADRAVAVIAALVLVGSIALLVRHAKGSARTAAALAASAGAAGIVVPIVLAAVGLDYVNTRNALVALVPLAVAAPAGLVLAGTRVAELAFVAVVALLLVVSVVVATDPDYHRPDWRGFAQDLGPPEGARAIVIAPDHLGWFARVPLQVYVPQARAVDENHAPAPPQFRRVSRRAVDHSTPPSIRVRELVLGAFGWELPRPAAAILAPFTRVEDRNVHGYRLVRFRSPVPVELPTPALAVPRAAVLLQEPASP